MLDYCAFYPVWPTTAREFCIACHWEVLQRQRKRRRPSTSSAGAAAPNNDVEIRTEKAIVVYAFSCPEADAMKPLVEDHVRGKLRLSIVLLRPHSTADGAHGCHMTRILTFDLGGNISQRLTNIVVTQQARIPSVINEYLNRIDARPSATDPEAASEISTQRLVKDLIHRSLIRLPKKSGDLQRKLTCLPKDGASTDQAPATSTSLSSRRWEPPTVLTQALILLFPVLLCRAFMWCQASMPLSLFVLVAFSAVRRVTMSRLGRIFPSASVQRSEIGVVTCQLKVDISETLRFMNTVNVERAELQRNGSGKEISVLHVVISAVGHALATEPILCAKRVKIPALLIDEYVDTATDSVVVSVLEGTRLITLDEVNHVSVVVGADKAYHAFETGLPPRLGAHGLVVAPGGPGLKDVQLTMSPASSGISVVVAIGGVQAAEPPSKHKKSSQTPTSLTLTISVYPLSIRSVAAIPRFVEEVRNLVQNPDIGVVRIDS
jgi:hypothetical protein